MKAAIRELHVMTDREHLYILYSLNCKAVAELVQNIEGLKYIGYWTNKPAKQLLFLSLINVRFFGFNTITITLAWKLHRW